MTNNNFILDQAQKLIEEHGKKAVDVVKRKIANLNNQHSRESDSAFMLLSEVENLADKL